HPRRAELRPGGEQGRQRPGPGQSPVQRVLLPVRGDVRAPHRGGGGGHGHDQAEHATAPAVRSPPPERRPRRRAGSGGVRTPIAYFLILSGVLFTIGTVGVLVRRNALVIFMSVELQLNAVNLSLVAFSRQIGNLNGQVLAFFSMVVAAAEVVVGLAIIVALFRRRRSANVDDVNLLRWCAGTPPARSLCGGWGRCA